MYYAPAFQEFFIPVQEHGMGEPFACPGTLRLGIGKCDPDLVDLGCGKTMINKIYPRSQKPDIAELILNGLFCTCPDPVALNIHPYIIYRRVLSCKTYRVFAFSAAQ